MPAPSAALWIQALLGLELHLLRQKLSTAGFNFLLRFLSLRLRHPSSKSAMLKS